jgi:glycosyltransferase involved in cell wall biosynthesis
MVVSIVIPIYNVSDYIDTCLISVINQTYNKIQVVAVNDGSTDNSLQILKSYALKDIRIIVIDKPNGGLASAREAGIKASTGEYITILDGDDSLPLNAIEKYVKAIEHTNADIVLGAFVYLYPQFNKEKKETLLYNGIISNIDYLRLILGLKVAPGISCKIFNRRLFDNVIMPHFKSGQDIPLSVQLAIRSREILFLREPMYNYLLLNFESGRNKSSDYIEDYYKAIKWTIDYTKQLNIEYIEDDIELFELIMTIDVMQRNGFFVVKENMLELKTIYNRRKNELKLWQRFIFNSFMWGDYMGCLSNYIVIKARKLYIRFANF